MANMLKIYFNDNQNVEENNSLSPSAGKPKLFVDEVKSLAGVSVVSAFEPVTRDQLKLVHDPKHVDDILDLKKENGFDNRLGSIAASLMWTNGSFYSAAREAYTSKLNTCSPTSGFHHAEYGLSQGFCTFNGLALAAQLLKTEFPAIKIAIVDIDDHYGNGTDDILNRLGMANYVKHYTFGGVVRTYARNQKGIFHAFKEHLQLWLETAKGSDVIFYQAGADPHVDDPYGGHLETDELQERDRIVFEFGKQNNIPVVWNLAGGYQTPISKVLEIHVNTVKECLAAMK
jgi:acetoin utilization deacetylase AcuC-like enzyme